MREAGVVVAMAEQVWLAGRREDEVLVHDAGSGSESGVSARAHRLFNHVIKMAEEQGFDLIAHEVDG